MKTSNLKRLLQVALLFVLLVAVSAGTVSASETLTVHFLDVGQGDSELLQFAGKNILIDAGDQDSGPRVESYLRSHGVSSLDLLVATHPHEDHIGGLMTILNDIPVGQVLDSGQAHTSQTFENYLNLIDRKNIPFSTAERGQTIDLDPAIKIEVLSPPATLFSGDLNQNSIVLKVTYNKVSFLFMGDAGFVAEDSIMAAGYDLKSTVLKVGHHGSSSSTGTSFLSKVRPEVEIIEVGASNDYGHPSGKTLSALQSTSSKIYRTDTSGDIVVTTDGQSYSVSTEKQSWNTASATPQTTASAITMPAGPFAASASTTSQEAFVGSTNSNKYHYPSCQWAQKIKPCNEICFSCCADARAHGYVPCGVCHPP